ncbi:MAG: hypothetical protein OIF56_14885 [Cohaesibacter sp.]|nr:hypothetical protein [Cohaesibacter sp.]
MTPFSTILSISSLSQREAANFLAVSTSIVDKWSRGVRTPRPEVIREMTNLVQKQQETARQMLKIVNENEMEAIELGFPTNDHEAQCLGWPCVGAWKGMAGRFIADCTKPVNLVPRGSTPAAAAARDQQDFQPAKRKK